MVREYIGSGSTAVLIARMDALDRGAAEIARFDLRAERARMQEITTEIVAFCRLTDALARAALIEAGYHQHARGQWRKRRLHDEGKDMSKNTELDAIRQEMAVRAAAIPEDEAERHAIISRAIRGDKKAEAQALAILRRYPDEFLIGYGNPRRAVVELIAGNSPITEHMIEHEYNLKLKEIAGPHPSPLEKILAERIVVCRMQLAFWETDYAAASAKGMLLAVGTYKQKRLDRAYARLLAAVKALAQIRRLGLPTVQVNIGQHQNIGEKQVNISDG